jgi:glutamyl-tRNA synthetase
MSGYRGRIAPSPTGLLHLGHARTFWMAQQRARAAGGVLVFRNDDLDQQRCKPEFVRAMYEDLRWLGIEWQEGPDIGGPHAPYSQSKRRESYLRAWRRLAEMGAIFPCTCSRKDLAQALAAPHDEADEVPYPGTCRDKPWTMPVSPAGVSWRFRAGENVVFDDALAGRQEFAIMDFLVWRRDDVPAYQLACVVDDHEMEITEVVRGADLLKSTARQLLIYRALGWEPPRWAHAPLMMDEHGMRLAKRHDALALRKLRERGMSPEEARKSF